MDVRRPTSSLIEYQQHYSPENGDDEAAEVEAVDGAVTERRSDKTADDRAGDAEKYR